MCHQLRTHSKAWAWSTDIPNGGSWLSVSRMPESLMAAETVSGCLAYFFVFVNFGIGDLVLWHIARSSECRYGPNKQCIIY